uniref:BPTI/Kunitz inhibitor domain-containing protein n=1 Tax=Anser brachyrhynchus TaxID=132585 RepID=A0A8B9I559_9AVES
ELEATWGMGSAWAPVLAGAEVVPESPLAGSPSSAHLGPRDHADFCYLPSVCGNCKALFIRFFYNASSQRCEEFIYGGCGGNRNNFETKRECFQCPALVASPVLQSDICHLPPEHGPCRGHFYRYAYNPATGTCRVFLYGGCRGNANNFETLKECQRACQRAGHRSRTPGAGAKWVGDAQGWAQGMPRGGAFGSAGGGLVLCVRPAAPRHRCACALPTRCQL